KYALASARALVSDGVASYSCGSLPTGTILCTATSSPPTSSTMPDRIEKDDTTWSRSSSAASSVVPQPVSVSAPMAVTAVAVGQNLGIERCLPWFVRWLRCCYAHEFFVIESRQILGMGQRKKPARTWRRPPAQWQARIAIPRYSCSTCQQQKTACQELRRATSWWRTF